MRSLPQAVERLPVCRYVIETDRGCYRPVRSDRPVHRRRPQLGSNGSSLRMDGLLFAVLAEAVADIRRIRHAHRGEVRPDRYSTPPLRSPAKCCMVSSAGFILNF